MTQIVDGIGEVRVRKEADGRRVAVNVTPGTTDAEELARAKIIDGFKVKGAGDGTIVGNWLQHVKGSLGSAAQLKIQEGLWEVKRGRKIHGGERRRKNVLSRIAAKERGTLT